jgi:hypothetical protein
MSTTIQIRRAQLLGAMTSPCVQSIAALQQGRRLANASVNSKQRAALAGITGYWAMRALPSQFAGRNPHDAAGLGVSLLGNSIIAQGEIAVL